MTAKGTKDDMTRQSKNDQVRGALLEIVENQLRDATPPETAATLKRLMSEGHSRARAVEMIAVVVGCELNDMVKNRESFQEWRYVESLRALPRSAPTTGCRGREATRGDE